MQRSQFNKRFTRNLFSNQIQSMEIKMRPKIILFLIAFIILLYVTQCANPENDKAKKVDQFITACFGKNIFNGTILVAENGKTIYKNALGYLDFETKEKLQINSPFYLASVSKQFTAMSIMILKEQNKLKYEDKLSDYFPEFPSYSNQVTIRHLLTHTSGIPNHYRLGAYKKDLTNQEVLEILIKQDTLDFNPGENYSYSNGGYVLLAMIAEKASAKPFHEFLKEQIFNPLGMNQSLVYDESKPEIPLRAIGHNNFGDINDYEILTTGAGGIYSTVEDLYLWDQALYTEKLVKSETLNDAFEPFKLNNDSISNYGFGWKIEQDKTGKIVSHGGALVGYRTYIERNLSSKNTIIFLTNRGSTTSFDKLSDAIVNILNNQPYQIPRIPISIEMHRIIESKGIDQAVIRYNELKQNDEESYNFSESQLNDLGYFYLTDEKSVNNAIKIFKLNVKSFPDSFNPYDSLGEAYMINKDYALAIKNYEKSIELNPNNTNAELMIKRLMKN